MATAAYDKGTPTSCRLVNAHEQLYAVDSHRGEARSYLVSLKASTCSCPHFTARLAGTGQTCKHLDSVKAQVTAAPRPAIGTSVKVWGPTTEAESDAALRAFFA